MKKFGTIIFTFCGLLMLAAFPVFGQNDNEPPKEVEINKKPFEDFNKAVVEKVEKDKATTVSDIQINEKSFTYFAQYVLAKIENDKTDLSQPFKVVLEGTLVKKVGNDGDIVVLDSNKSKWIALANEEAGNREVGGIARSAIEAVSDSGVFAYLYNFGIKDLTITFYQTADKVAVNLESKQETAQRAKSLANGFSGLFQMAKMTTKGEDEKFLMSGFQNSSANDKTLLINFELPTNTVHEMINRNLTNYKNRKLSEQK